MSYKEEFIEFMARSGALLFGDFTTKSGRRSPYFINTGAYRTGAQIARLGRFYADCVEANIAAGHIDGGVRALFGPAYKGVPIAVSAAIALSERGRPVNYCFNRKEAKDHGEGGGLVGHVPEDGDRLLIVEDVITAGTAFREVFPLLKSVADVRIEGLVVSVDRMERGTGDRGAAAEIFEEYGVRTFPIVTVREIADYLHGRSVDGETLIGDETMKRMEDYFARYCAPAGGR